MSSIRLVCLALAALVAVSTAPSARAQKESAPTDAVLAFYGLLRDRRYVEGFAHSVYRNAVAGLSQEDLVELEPEFARTFAAIPAKIEVKGSQVTGDVATVFLTLGDDPAVQEVTLVRVADEWLVGDREALEQVERDKTAFFFNARIHVNHTEAYQVLKNIMGSEAVRLESKKAYGTLQELLAEGLRDEFEGEISSGYRFVVSLTPARDAYTVVAIPARYGRTGKLSYFTDGTAIHAADANGMPVNEQAPVLEANEVAPAQ